MKDFSLIFSVQRHSNAVEYYPISSRDQEKPNFVDTPQVLSSMTMTINILCVMLIDRCPGNTGRPKKSARQTAL
jgi:hypothetical protein